MKDGRTSLITGLKAAIDAKSTGLTFYTKVPKSASYPFIYVTDIYDIEDGNKKQFMYQYELTVQVVYKDLTDKSAMWAAVNSIKEIIVKGSPFSISGGFNIMEMTLIDTDETTALIDSQEVDTTIIRMNFQIEDNN